MKPKILFLSTLLCLILASACKKDSGDSPLAKIQSLTTYSSTGAIANITTYLYDDQGRIARQSVSDGSYTTFEYTSTTVTTNTHRSDAFLLETDVYTLNSKGQAQSLTSTTYSGSGSTTTSVVKNYSFEYDNSGYLVKTSGSSTVGLSVYKYANTYTIASANTATASLTSTQNYTSGSNTTSYVVSDTYAYGYLAGKTNSIGNANMGITFLGTQNNNLTDSCTRVNISSYPNVATSTNSTIYYTYEYNDNGYVAKKVALTTTGSGTSASSASVVTSYTYK
jgi:YD repeat-containing protein